MDDSSRNSDNLWLDNSELVFSEEMEFLSSDIKAFDSNIDLGSNNSKAWLCDSPPIVFNDCDEYLLQNEQWSGARSSVSESSSNVSVGQYMKNEGIQTDNFSDSDECRHLVLDLDVNQISSDVNNSNQSNIASSSKRDKVKSYLLDLDLDLAEHEKVNSRSRFPRAISPLNGSTMLANGVSRDELRTCHGLKKKPITVYVGDSKPGGSERHYSLGDSNSKNAVAARENRLKKKMYVTGLEQTVQELQTENEQLQQEAQMCQQSVHTLRQEVAYLKSVIANQSTLSAVLKNVAKTPGINLTSTLSCESGKSTYHLRNNSSKAKTRLKTDYKGFVQKASTSTPPMKKKFEIVAKQFLNQRKGLKSSKPNTESTKRVSLSKQNRKGSTISILDQSGMTAKRRKIVSVASNEFDCDRKMNLGPQNDRDQNDIEDKCSDSCMPEDYGGICLHVSGQRVSLEFCAHCNTSAKSQVLTDHCYVKH